jgi:tetratricopeptide (TPR) repeat protein
MAHGLAGRRALAALGILLLAAVAVAAWHLVGPRFGSSDPSPGAASPTGAVSAPGSADGVQGRPSAAVVDWRPCRGELPLGLGAGVAELATAELAADGRVRVVSGAEVSTMAVDLQLDKVARAVEEEGEAAEAAADLPAVDAGDVARHLGVDLLLFGDCEMALEGDRIQLSVRVVSAAGAAVGSAGTSEAPQNLSRAVVSLMEAVHRELPHSEEEGAGDLSTGAAGLPRDLTALAAYGGGLRRLWGKIDAERRQAAEEWLERAVQRAPENPWVWLALGEARQERGRGAPRREAARRALELVAADAAGGAVDRLWITARARRLLGEWPAAATAYRSLAQRFPDDPVPLLEALRMELRAGEGERAAALLPALAALPPPMAEDPRFALAAGEVARFQGDAEGALQAARQAQAWAEARGARRRLAAAKVLEAELLTARGDLEEAVRSATEGRRLCADLGLGEGMARADYALAEIRTRQGDPAGAEAGYQQALAALENSGDGGAVAALQLRRARFVAGLGNGGLAADLEEKARRQYVELQDDQGLGEVALQRSRRLREGGDWVNAERALRDALSWFAGAQDSRGEARAYLALGSLMAARERLQPARAAYEQAIDIAPDPGLEADARSGMAEGLLLSGDVAAARREQEAALVLRRDLGEEAGVLRTRLALAALDLEQGRPEAARAAVEAILLELRNNRDVAGEASAQLLLARVHLEHKDVAAARRSLDTARSLGRRAASPAAVLAMDLLDARIAVAEGNLLRARALFQELRRRTVESRRLGPDLEVRLAQGAFLRRDGKEQQGVALLRNVAAEASARGFGLLAERAEALLATPAGEVGV